MTGAKPRRKGHDFERPHGEWKPIDLHPGYWVSRDGRIWSDRSMRLLRGLKSRDGYLKVQLCGGNGFKAKQKFVHRLVAESFVAGSGEQVRHIDGDKTNNRAENLAWGTCRENILDKWAHGKMPHGDSHHANKIPVADIPEIRESKESNSAIAAWYGVSRTAIYLIRKGRNYGWL